MIIKVKVIPNAKRNELVKTDSGYRVRITATPVDGKANDALVEFLSKEFKVSKRSIEIIKGQTGRNKTIEINS